MVRRPELYTYRLRGDVKKTADRLEAYFRQAKGHGGLVEEANEKALAWIEQRAAGNLENSMRASRRPQQFNTGELRKTIFAETSHTVTPAGFRFMVENKVRARIPYAFSIEYGDRSQVGQVRWFTFLGRAPFKPPPGLNRAQVRRQAEQINPNFNRRSDTTRGGSFRTPQRPNARRGNAFLGVTGHSYKGAADTVTDRIIGSRELVGKKVGYITNAKRYRVVIRNPVPEYAYGRKASQTFKDAGIYQKTLLDLFEAKFKAPDTLLVPGKKVRKGRGPKFPVTVTKIPTD